MAESCIGGFMSCSTRYPLPSSTLHTPQKLHPQLLTAEDFTHNSFVKTNLRGNLPYPNENKEFEGGRGYPEPFPLRMFQNGTGIGIPAAVRHRFRPLPPCTTMPARRKTWPPQPPLKPSPKSTPTRSSSTSVVLRAFSTARA